MMPQKEQKFENVILFDRQYSKEEIAEGRAIHWAVVSGACNKCKHLKECDSNSRFVFPKTAACMKKKAELLKKMR